jgi:hypothetical protein
MTEPRPADPVDPEQLFQASMIVAHDGRSKGSHRPCVSADAKILDRIVAELGVAPEAAANLLRRCCAMGNFLSVESNRAMAGVDNFKPRPSVWAAAATAPVHRAIMDGAACDTFDPREFAAALMEGASTERDETDEDESPI